MLKHIVAWKFKESAENADKYHNLQKAKALLESLKGKITEIRAFEIGIDVSRGDQSFDLVLYSEFVNREALASYQKHEDHVRVAEFLRKVQLSKGVIDYEV